MPQRLSPEQRALAEQLKARLTPATKSRTLTGRAPDEAAATPLLDTILAEDEPVARRMLDTASKGSLKRGEALSFLLVDRGDKGQEAADTYLRMILGTPGDPRRNGLVQRLKFGGGTNTPPDARRRFLPDLTRIIEQRGDPDWAFAVGTVGFLAKPGDDDAISALMAVSAGPATPFCVLQALTRIAPPEAIIGFEMVILNPVDKRQEVVALEGLGKLGSLPAIGALIDHLDDPVIKTETRFSPGVGGDAARALGRIHGWDLPDPWREAVGVAREASARTFPAGFAEACRRARARSGLFDDLERIMSAAP